MDCIRVMNNKIPQQVSFAKRALSLFILITLCVSYGVWYFFREQKINVLRDTEIALRTEARTTVSAISIWYAPIKHQGILFATSPLIQAFMAERTVPFIETGAINNDDDNRRLERLMAQTDAMHLYLKRLEKRVNALKASLVDINGQEIVDSLADRSSSGSEIISDGLNQKAVSTALTKGTVVVLDVRHNSFGLLADVVFPVYAEKNEHGEAPLIGGIVLTLPLDEEIMEWLASDSPESRSVFLLEKTDSGINSISAHGVSPQEWRHGEIVPGSTQNPAPEYAEEILQYTPRKNIAGFWRLSRYAIPSQGNTPDRLVQAVGLNVPIIPTWAVVKEIPAEQTIAHINSLRTQAVVVGIAVTVVLFLFAWLHWWWFDGRVEQQLCDFINSKRTQLTPLINSVLPDGIYLTDPNGQFQYVNKSFATMFKKIPQDFKDKTVFDVFDDRQALQHNKLDAEVLSTFKPITFIDTLNDDASTTQHKYEIHKIPLTGENLQIMGVVSVFHKLEN